MSVRAEYLQRANFKDEKQIFDNLQKSSSATANTLVSVRDSLSPVKLSLEKQVELFYDVQINAVYNEGTKKLMLVNNGRANVTLWAQGVGEETEKMMPYPQSVTITPNSSYEIPLESGMNACRRNFRKDKSIYSNSRFL
jgi:hypothetical protein